MAPNTNIVAACRIKNGFAIDGTRASHERDNTEDSFYNFFKEVDLNKIEMASARWVTFELEALLWYKDFLL